MSLTTDRSASPLIDSRATSLLFMSGSAYGFTSGRISVFQALLAEPGRRAAWIFHLRVST